MKTIRYTREFTQPDGFPFYVSNPDPAIREVAIAEAVQLGRETAIVPRIPAQFFADIIIWFMNNLPFEMDLDKNPPRPVRKQTAEDMGNNYTVIKEFRRIIAEDDDKYELDEPVHTWLVKQVDLEGPVAFGNSQPEVAKRLNDVVVGEKASKISPETTE